MFSIAQMIEAAIGILVGALVSMIGLGGHSNNNHHNNFLK